MEKPQIIGHIEKSLNYTIFDCKWISESAKFVTLGSLPKGTGIIEIYEVGAGDTEKLLQIENSKTLRCGTFGASRGNKNHLATGDFDGKLKIWDIENSKVPIYTACAHKEMVMCIDGVGAFGKDIGAPEILTGGKDGTVNVWDPRQKDEPVASIKSEDSEPRECWTAAFGNAFNSTERALVSGYDNGDVKLFDLRKMAVAWETNVKNGVCSIEFDRKDTIMNKMVVTTLESKIFLYDMRTYHEEKGYASLTEKAHNSTIWCVKHLPQNRDIFMTCGGSGTLNLWKYSYPNSRKVKMGDGKDMGVVGSLTLLQNVTLSTQPIAGFDWCPDKAGLAICSSFDQAFRLVIVTKLNRV